MPSSSTPLTDDERRRIEAEEQFRYETRARLRRERFHRFRKRLAFGAAAGLLLFLAVFFYPDIAEGVRMGRFATNSLHRLHNRFFAADEDSLLVYLRERPAPEPVPAGDAAEVRIVTCKYRTRACLVEFRTGRSQGKLGWVLTSWLD